VLFRSPAAASDGAAGAGGDRIASGSGLVNLRKRLAAVGGRCEIRSGAGGGTRVEMTVAIHPAASPVMAIGESRPVG
jgi:signal transduction histidine kinase